MSDKTSHWPDPQILKQAGFQLADLLCFLPPKIIREWREPVRETRQETEFSVC